MIEVVVSGPAVRGLPRREIAAFVETSLAALRRRRVVEHPVSEVSIAFIDDRQMKRLNLQYRGKNGTTDVLTFEADAADLPPDESSVPLGEIIISLDQARRQARAEQHSLPTEIRYLILHGIIHALGYDHEADDGEMNRLEQSVRRSVGLD